MPKKPKHVKKDSISFLLNNEESDSEIDHGDLENELHELLGNDPNESLSDSVDVSDPALIAELEAFASVNTEEDSTTESSAPEPARGGRSPANNTQVTQSDLDSLMAQYFAATDSLRSKDHVDTVKLRRYERVIKDLESLSSRLSAGRPVLPDELPPPPVPSDLITAKEVVTEPDKNAFASRDSTNLKPSTPPPALAKPSTSTVANNPLLQLKTRGQEYKLAAVKARDSGQMARAKELLIAAKFIEDMLPKVESGEEPFDPDSDMPPPPDEYLPAAADSNPPPPPPPPAPSKSSAMLSTAVTVENLKQRMAYFQTTLESSQSDPPKARRMQRILAEYNTALNALQHQVTSFDFSSLPSPPGCPNLVKTFPRSPGAVQQNDQAPATSSELNEGGGKNAKVINLLKTRQAELKAAALKAKQSGDMGLAKSHLKAALSMNPLIESALAGQPIDLSKVPRLAQHQQPMAQTAFHGSIMTGKPCDVPTTLHLELESAANELEKQEKLLSVLKTQLAEAQELSHKLSESGFLECASKVTDLAKLCEASITFLAKSMKRQQRVPFAFEWANLPQLNFNHDLGEGVLEVCVARGMAYPLPADVSHADKLDTQVELVLPYPTSDNPQKHYTDWVKHTCDPNYDSVVRFQFDMKSRVFQFLLKSGRCLRATVYYSRGFLRSARVLGTVNFPLNDLAHSVTFTVVGDLMDGRKAIGGRLQLRVRQRSAAASSQLTACSKPWLVLTLSKPAYEPAVSNRQGPPSPHRPSDPGRPSPSHDLRTQRSPRASAVSIEQATVNNHSQKQAQAIERLHSLDMLRDERQYLEKRLADPGLPMEKRHRYESEQRRVIHLIDGLKARLESATEFKVYVGELRTLISQTEQRYQQYSAENNNTRSAADCKYQLEIMKRELERYTRS